MEHAELNDVSFPKKDFLINETCYQMDLTLINPYIKNEFTPLSQQMEVCWIDVISPNKSMYPPIFTLS